MHEVTITVAAPEILAELKSIIERAYRGDSARLGWTHEADIITSGERISHEELAAYAADTSSRLLTAMQAGKPIGCVLIRNVGGGLCYLGLLCVDPEVQATGLGKQLMQAAEHIAREEFDAHEIEMTVIEQRSELIAWYVKHGYQITGERRDFPYDYAPELFMTVLNKSFI